MKNRDENYEVGDEVRYRMPSSGYSSQTVEGKIEKISAANVITIVDARGKKYQSRPSKWGRTHGRIEHMSAHDKARAAWLAREPKSEGLAWVDHGYYRRAGDVCGASVSRELDSIEKIREASAKLVEIADWWASEPEENP